MSKEVYWMGSNTVRNELLKRITDMDIDGSMKVEISESKSKSARQRGLQWTWYAEVAKSGIGRHDDKELIDIDSKWQFGRPIMLRDDEFFCDLWPLIQDRYNDDPDRLREAVAFSIHTERFSTSQMAEFLTEFERYWRPKGVDLTIPQDKGLLK